MHIHHILPDLVWNISVTVKMKRNECNPLIVVFTLLKYEKMFKKMLYTHQHLMSL